MSAFQCDLCQKVFKLKTDLERHKNKKAPCVSVEKIVELHKVENELKTNNEDINKVKKFLDFCHNTLRDKEGIVGMKALSNIAMLLFLKFVNNSVKEGTIDLLKIKKYREEEGTHKNNNFNKCEDYIKYCQFDNIIENGKFKVEPNELIFIIEFILNMYYGITQQLSKYLLMNFQV